VGAVSKNLPDNLGEDIVAPAVQGVVYKIFARYTVREIFSTKRAEIQQAIEADLAAKLATDGSSCARSR
jgi:regulator of protease activity HflC (stomatin/prohibitin superfamily)